MTDNNNNNNNDNNDNDDEISPPFSSSSSPDDNESFLPLPLLYEIEVYDAITESVYIFHLLGRSFSEVYEDVIFYCDDSLGENSWEILRLDLKHEIKIMNVYHFLEDEKTNDNKNGNHFQWEGGEACPMCIVTNGLIELDRVMKFNCTCGEELIVGDTGWTKCYCPGCNNEILRIDIIRDSETGKLIYTKSNQR